MRPVSARGMAPSDPIWQVSGARTEDRAQASKHNRPLERDAFRSRGLQAFLAEGVLLDLDYRAGLDQLGLGRGGFFLGGALLDAGGGALNHILGLLEAEVG